MAKKKPGKKNAAVASTSKQPVKDQDNGNKKKTKKRKDQVQEEQMEKLSISKKIEKKQAVLLADDDSSSSEDEAEPTAPAENASVSTEEEQPSEASDEDGQSEEEQEVEQQPSEPPAAAAIAPKFKSDGRYHNKQRCLILSSRGITSRYRHFVEDLKTLIPHHKKDSKLSASKKQTGGIGAAVNDIAEIRGCNSVLFVECRKRQDAYMWIGHTGNGSGGSRTSSSGGPSAKFLVENIHTMDELKLTGNCMRGSRPILSFDQNFDKRQELKLLKCLFTDVFGTPRGHPKSKAFVDRVMGFYYADGKIWVRNYQILEQHASTAKEAHTEKKLHGKAMSTSLVEIGPRFVLNPIRIFRGSFGGQTLYQNEQFVSPNAVRAMTAKNKGRHYEDRKNAQKKRKLRQENMVLPEDPLDSVFR